MNETDNLPPECYHLYVRENVLYVAAGDRLGFVYGLYEISRRFLGVSPFWFWNDEKNHPVEQTLIPETFDYISKPAKVRYRGWFINDETLLSHWKVERREDMPFIMAFETLLRLGGNLIIPGTGTNAKKYREIATDMGLILTHHHAEPLGSEMFSHVYPKLEPKFRVHPDKFRELWEKGNVRF